MFSNNLPVINIMAWPLNVECFDSDLMKGPVPTLFAEDPDLALPAIQSNLTKVQADLAKLLHIFFIPETHEPLAAVKLLKNPRIQGNL